MSSLFWLKFPIVLIDMGTTCHIITNFVFNVHFHDICNIMLTIMVQHNLILKRNVKKKKNLGSQTPNLLGNIWNIKNYTTKPFFSKKIKIFQQILLIINGRYNMLTNCLYVLLVNMITNILFLYIWILFYYTSLYIFISYKFMHSGYFTNSIIIEYWTYVHYGLICQF